MPSKSLQIFLVGRDLSASSSLAKLRGEMQATAGGGAKLGTALKTGLALGAGAAIGLGIEAVRMASRFEEAETRLKGAVTNVGGSFDKLKPQVDDLDHRMARLGFTGTSVESALANLVTATKDPTKAIGLMGLAADIARGRNIDLAASTNILVKVETGHVGLLGRLGIATKDATGHTISQAEAIRRLTQLYGGDAQRSASTFAGKLRALGAQADDVGVRIGTVLIPVVSDVLSIFLGTAHAAESVVHWFERHQAATVALATAIGVLLIPEMIELTADAVKFVAVNVAEAFFLAADAAKDLAASATAVDLAMAPIVVVAVASAVVVVKSWESQKKAIEAGKKSADDYADSLLKSTNSVDFMQSSLDKLTTKYQDQAAVVVQMIRSGNIVSNNFFKQSAALGEYSSRLDAAKAAEATAATNQQALARQFHLTTAQVETLAAVNSIDLTQSLDGVSQKFRDAMKATEATHHPLSAVQKDLRAVSDRAVPLTDQLKALKAGFDGLIGSSLDAHDATVTFYDDVATLTEKLKASKGSMALTTQASRDAAHAFRDTVDQIEATIAAEKTAGYQNKTIKRTIDDMIAALEKSGGKNAYVRAEVAKLKDMERGLELQVYKTNAALASVPVTTIKTPNGTYQTGGRGGQGTPDGTRRNVMFGSGGSTVSHHYNVTVNGIVGTPTEAAKVVMREVKRLSANGATLR